MDGSEVLVLLFSLVAATWFLFRWYQRISKAWPATRGLETKLALGLLPPACYAGVHAILRVLADLWVVGDSFWTFFYNLWGVTWLAFAMFVMFFCFNISWVDDALQNNNHAALSAVVGGGMGVMAIYAGANIGDGPGWWCVLFAGGLGVLTWIGLGSILNIYARFTARITVERDLGCAIRVGAFFLAAGILLGRASSGDWTSFFLTCVEFLDGWPVLILTLAAILTERMLRKSPQKLPLWESIAIGVAYVVFAIACVALIPSIQETEFHNILWAKAV